jgi:ribosomal protein L11 methyltransferase
MKWNEVSLTISRDAAEAAANVFFEIGAQGVVIEDPHDIDRYIREDRWDCYDIPLDCLSGDGVIVKGYLPADDSFAESMEGFRKQVVWLQKCFPACDAEVCIREMAEEDWATSWKQYYKTTKIGRRVIVQPEWEEYNPEPGEIVVKMDPGSAFGTGTHATTIMCVRLLEKYLVPGQMVFDVGCGSGILSAVAVKLGANFVFARDIDPAAIHAARNNAELNCITDSIEVESGYYLNGVQGKANLIVSNIVSDAIIEFSAQAFSKLLPGGRFISSGIIAERMEEVEEELKAAGFSILETITKGEWVAIAAQKGNSV